eukprot:293302-Pyramimonas_sp.AAC.1
MAVVKLEANIGRYSTAISACEKGQWQAILARLSTVNSVCEKRRPWQWQPVVALRDEIVVAKLERNITHCVLNSARGKGMRW